jgi:hypothetical protein
MEHKSLIDTTLVDFASDVGNFEAQAEKHYRTHCRVRQQDFKLCSRIEVDSEYFLGLETYEKDPFPFAYEHQSRPEGWFHDKFRYRLIASPTDTKHPTVLDLQKKLKLDVMYCVQQTQQPGHIVSLHVDVNRNLCKQIVEQGLQHQALLRHLRKYIVYLADWQPGQVFMCGRGAHTNWKKGDVLSFEWYMPHSTANAGWHDRPTLFIAGVEL